MSNYCYTHNRKWEPGPDGRGSFCHECKPEKLKGDKNELSKVQEGERKVYGKENKDKGKSDGKEVRS